MIAQLRGKIIDVRNSEAVLDVNGVGYQVHVPATFLKKPGEEVVLYIKTVVREDDFSLYGFETSDEKLVFNLLKTVSGIGPKTALGIISFYSVADLTSIISSRDIRLLSKVPGIGQKTAERVIVELKDKIATCCSGLPATARTAQASVGASGLYDELLQALLGLGYKHSEAVAALNRHQESIKKGNRIEDILRETLRGMV
jgi:holliday junction DNA helicase RuvA